MDWSDIQARIASGEDDSTEFKRGLGDLRPIGRAVCAFANTRGGVVILGVEDDGNVTGVSLQPSNVQERLTSFLQSGASAPVAARLGSHLFESGWVHWVEVPRQRGYEPLRFEGRVWVRRGRASVEPSPSELQELYNTFGYILTEERTIEAATPRDIDTETFHSFLRAQGIPTDDEPQPSIEEDLLSRGVVRRVDRAIQATLYGVLAFGRDPQRYPQTRNFWIGCVAYGGVDRGADPILVGDAKGRLDEQVERALGFTRALGRQESTTGLLREDNPPVPESVLREALVNAVVHRDYSLTGSRVLLEFFDDRVCVMSPGGLPNHMTPSSVRAGGLPRSRNEWLAHFMVVRRQMEQRGRGWPLMRQRMREHNDTEPILEVFAEERFVRVTLLRTVTPRTA
ncbi:MAG: ArsR family transcriptional regulator [Myxococcales bacterium]